MADELSTSERTFGRRTRRLPSWMFTLLAAATLLALPGKAIAACHIASFVDDDVPVTEGQEVKVTVELVGGVPTCGGKIRYQTVNGTAKEPQDYARREGELTFVANNPNDRMQDIRIPTVNDTGDEPQETFTVRLSDVDPNDDISPDGTPATVRISDNDPAPASSPTTKKSASTSAASPRNTQTASPTPTGTGSATPTVSESPTPTDTPTLTDTGSPLAAPADEDGGGSGGLIAAVGAAVVVLGAAGLLLRRRMRSG